MQHRAEQDVGARVDRLRNLVGGVGNFLERQIGATTDVDQDAARPFDGCLKQWAGDRRPSRLDRTVVAIAFADRHQRGSSVGHDRLDVREVQVDQAGLGDQVRNALDTLAEDVVSEPEGVDHRHLGVAQCEQAIVRNDDQRVDSGAQSLEPFFGGLLAALTLESKRQGDDADRECACGAGKLGDERRSSGAGSAAHTRGNEDHVGAVERVLEYIAGALGRPRAGARVPAGAQAAGDAPPDGDLAQRRRGGQRLRVGVDDDKLYAPDACLNHAVDRVVAAAADAHDLDLGEAACL